MISEFKVTEAMIKKINLFPKFIYLVLGGALLFATLTNLPLAYDGSGYFLMCIHYNRPFTSQFRLSNEPLQFLVLIAKRFTENMFVLRFAFCISYASIPLIAIWLSWKAVRYKRPNLIIWAVLGICIIPLPMQGFFVSEWMTATQLFWPIWLAILVSRDPNLTYNNAFGGIRTLHGLNPILLGFLVFIVAMLHPAAFLYFVMGAMLLIILSILYRIISPGWIILMILTAFLIWFKLRFTQTTYDRGVLAQFSNFETFREIFSKELGWKLVLSNLLAILGMMLIFTGISKQKSWIQLIGLYCIILACGIIMLWALEEDKLYCAFMYRMWLSIPSILALAIAALNSYFNPVKEDMIIKVHKMSAMAVIIMIITFVGVIIIQSINWYQSVSRMEQELAKGNSIVFTDDMKWLREPLAFWVPTYSMIVQDRQPSKMIMKRDFYERSRYGGGIMLHEFLVLRWNVPGWLDLSTLRQHIERTTLPPVGYYYLDKGWHRVEENIWGW
jgi:hypothetical protein